MKEFSIVLPVKDEADMLNQSLQSAISLHPSEIVLVVDAKSMRNPAYHDILAIAAKVAGANDYKGLHICEVSPNPKWKFHQAWVRRCGYVEARYDRIFTFDVDSILYLTVLQGYDLLGKNNVAFVTFKKDLAGRGIVRATASTLRNAYHLLSPLVRAVRVRQYNSGVGLPTKPPKPFPGLYWLYKPWYLELVPECEISQIYNGEDTFLAEKLRSQDKYQHIHMDTVGVRMLGRSENEELPFRQYEFGFWLGCKGIFKIAFVNMVLRLQPKVFQGYAASKRVSNEIRERVASMTYPEFIMYGQGIVRMR